VEEVTEVQVREAPPVIIRIAEIGDEGFIFHSWLKSYRGSAAAQNITNPRYFAGQHALITRLLGRSKILVAANPEDPSQICGWIVYEPKAPIPVLHYVYVKHPFRRNGIARELIAQMECDTFFFTHSTEAVKQLTARAIFDPYLTFNGGES
jgi:GNAT superfamily N-acetyltransferase